MEEKINKERRIFVFVIAAIFVIFLVGMTYAFFNYTRTGTANNIKTGRIYFNSTQNGTLNLTNLFPVASSEAGNDNQIEVRVYGDTTYASGEEFLISLVDVNNTITSGSTEKIIPVNYIASYVPTQVATGEEPNNIGLSSNDYFTDRGSTNAIYQLNTGGTVSKGEQVLVGYIPKDVKVDGTLTIKAYLDVSNIAISDTYDETSPETDFNGTPTNWVSGRTLLTTSEWNTLQNTPISFKIRAEANEGIWVPNPGSAPMVIDTSSESESLVPGEIRNVEISPNGNGILSCNSSDINVATCSIENEITSISNNGINTELQFGDEILDNLKVQRLDSPDVKYLKITAIDEGTATITITQTAGSEYATPSVLTYDVVVAKLSTTMALSSNSGTILEGESITVAITTDGDGLLSCSSSTVNSTCSIAGNTLTINGVSSGSSIITVSQAVGITHLSPTDVTYSLSILLPTTINFVVGGGSMSQTSKTISPLATTYGNLDEPTPASGYLFAGWYTQDSGGTSITPTTAYVDGTSPTTLYAHYALESDVTCKRVTKEENLHTEICNSEYYGYCRTSHTKGSTITYGNAVYLGTDTLTIGDAFDCKVSTSGGYTERFYYVSPYFDTINESFDETYAALIYYSNTYYGSPTLTNGVYYRSTSNWSSENWYGPTYAKTHLPSASSWNNITLKSDTRAILAEYGSTHNAKATSGGTLPTAFSYSGRAARLLTAQELMRGCGVSNLPIYSSVMKKYEFLFERTSYAEVDRDMYSTWLETPDATSSGSVWGLDSQKVSLETDIAYNAYQGARPVIDIPLSKILK